MSDYFCHCKPPFDMVKLLVWVFPSVIGSHENYLPFTDSVFVISYMIAVKTYWFDYFLVRTFPSCLNTISTESDAVFGPCSYLIFCHCLILNHLIEPPFTLLMFFTLNRVFIIKVLIFFCSFILFIFLP